MQTREELIFEQRRSHSVHIIELKKSLKVSLIRLLSVLAASWNGYLFVYQFDIQKKHFCQKENHYLQRVTSQGQFEEKQARKTQ